MTVTAEATAPFDRWLSEMGPRLARFEDFQLPKGLPRDYSRESLAALETYLLDRWPDQQSFTTGDPDPDFTDGAVRYVGETLVRMGGGGWHYSEAEGFAFAGRPYVQLDTLDQTPISPYNLFTALLKRRTGTELVKVFDRQGARIEQRRAEESADWRPRRDAVPGVSDARDESGAAPAELTAWLDAIGPRSSSLGAKLGGLDGSPDSLAAVESLLLGSEVDPETRAEAAAYLGEVLRTTAGGDWVLRPGDPSVNRFLGVPHLARTDDHGDLRTSIPASWVDRLLDERTPGLLTRALDRYR